MGRTRKAPGFICVAHWQNEWVERTSKCNGKVIKRRWSFSPFGFPEIAGWVLMHYSESIKCHMGEYHTVRSWMNMNDMDGLMAQFKQMKQPTVPQSVWRELDKRTEKITKTDPWPGGDD